MTCISVDLPEPDGPMIATNSPGCDGEADTAHGRHLEAAGPVDLADVVEPEDRGGVHWPTPAGGPPAGELAAAGSCPPPGNCAAARELPLLLRSRSTCPTGAGKERTVTTTWSPSARPVGDDGRRAVDPAHGDRRRGDGAVLAQLHRGRAVVVRTAWVGTVSTSVSCLTVIATVAVVPACSPSGVPVTSMTTGKVAVPDDEDDATTPTLRTVPKTFSAAPVGVIVACRPLLQLAEVAARHARLDDPGRGVDDLDAGARRGGRAVGAAASTPCRSRHPTRPEPEPVESPTAYPTLATVPAIGARRVAPARAACASASWLRALARCAFAEARAS